MEDKFKKINLENETFKKRIGNLHGGLAFLKGVGFEEHGTELRIDNIDTKVVKEAIRLVENAQS
jgi:hypothetical protein